MSAGAPTTYVVERFEWRAVRYVGARHEPEWEGFVRLPGTRRLRSFPTAEEADAFCRVQEEAMRAKVNPFTCGGPALHYQSHLDADRLHDFLLDAGVEQPPRGKKIFWATWYEQTSLTAAQRAALWQALDRIRFYRVVEKPAGKTAYVVMRREWDYNDEWYYPLGEEGNPVEAYSTHEKAEAARRTWERNERTRWDRTTLEVNALRWARLEPGDPLPPRGAQDAFAEESDDRLFYEVVEVEVGE